MRLGQFRPKQLGCVWQGLLLSYDETFVPDRRAQSREIGPGHREVVPGNLSLRTILRRGYLNLLLMRLRREDMVRLAQDENREGRNRDIHLG